MVAGNSENVIELSKLDFSYSQDDRVTLILAGDWKMGQSLPDGKEALTGILRRPGVSGINFDASKLTSWDSAVLVFLRTIFLWAEQQQISVNTDGLPKGLQTLLKLATAVPERDTGSDPMETSLLSRIGDVSVSLTRSTGETLEFMGEVFLSLMRFVRGKARFRRYDFLQLLQESGAQALPIVTLINFLMGVILAFVGAVQLQQFGAEIFVANLVAIAMVREMGALMTAIILAGRSGAAFAAQLGTMMVNEEIDAFKTMGFSAMDFLVLPRLLALSLMVPLLALYADFLGIMGGAIVGVSMMDLSVLQYFEQTRGALNPTHFLLGSIKAGIYGGLVALAGCLRGMQSGRSASAVGSATTSAVVTGIVWIILACAITTVIYSVLGV
jgi:phospholipid/cholesterol/gamma-HCH transport system permease protein